MYNTNTMYNVCIVKCGFEICDFERETELWSCIHLLSIFGNIEIVIFLEGKQISVKIKGINWYSIANYMKELLNHEG